MRHHAAPGAVEQPLQCRAGRLISVNNMYGWRSGQCHQKYARKYVLIADAGTSKVI